MPRVNKPRRSPMISKKEKTTMNEKNNETKRKRNPGPVFSALEKCQAVLSIWTERVKPADVCREMGVTWMHIKHWQDRALEGMMQSLETRSGVAVVTALTPRLRAGLGERQGDEGGRRGG